MEDLELIAFKIISGVGAARSSYIEAIQAGARAAVKTEGMGIEPIREGFSPPQRF